MITTAIIYWFFGTIVGFFLGAYIGFHAGWDKAAEELSSLMEEIKDLLECVKKQQ